MRFLISAGAGGLPRQNQTTRPSRNGTRTPRRTSAILCAFAK